MHLVLKATTQQDTSSLTTNKGRKSKDKGEVKWNVLKPNESNPITVNNTYEGARQPTDPKDVNTMNKTRHEFIEMFDWPEFSGRKSVPIFRRNKKVRRDKNNKVMCNEEIPKQGRVNEVFIKQNNLNVYSTPSDLMNAFIA